MSSFMPEPVCILETQADVVAALADTSWYTSPADLMDRWHIKSLWLISLIDEIISKNGKSFAYDADVRILAEQRLGYPPKTDEEYCREGTPLSCLIYNAQRYRISDDLRARGYVPLLQGLIDQLGEGTKLETVGGKPLQIRNIGGKLYAMEPRKRRYAVSAVGGPVKIIKAGKTLCM